MAATAEKSRVLVVDDEPQITRVLRTVLTSQGYQVQTAAEGEAALANFAEFRPELVITDLYMPHMDGVELCRRVRESSNVPIIVLSVKGEERTKVDALDSGELQLDPAAAALVRDPAARVAVEAVVEVLQLVDIEARQGPGGAGDGAPGDIEVLGEDFQLVDAGFQLGRF